MTETKRHNMNIKKSSKTAKKEQPDKCFATKKEINKATDKVLIKYADAIRRLADR